jgi:hypothetical protein
MAHAVRRTPVPAPVWSPSTYGSRDMTWVEDRAMVPLLVALGVVSGLIRRL